MAADLAVALSIFGLTSSSAPAGPLQAATIDNAIRTAYDKYKGVRDGQSAGAIPVPANVDPNTFGIAIVTADGQLRATGDVTTQVSIESIAKVFTMARVLQDQGAAAIERVTGLDVPGPRPASLAAIEMAENLQSGPELNPLMNPGAIATTSMVQGTTSERIWSRIIGTYSDFAGRPLSVLQDVYESASDAASHNTAIAALLFANGLIKHDPQQAADLYTRQCAVGVTVKDLAQMAATLAFGGRNPLTGKQVVDAGNVPYLLAVMSTAGLHDDSSRWFHHTGLPAKSAVSGGLIAVSPGKFGIAVVSPPLDRAGISVRGQKAIADISDALGGNPYAATIR